MSRHEQTIRQLYDAVCAGATDRLRGYFHPDAEQVEYPSLMRPTGHRRGLDGILDGARLASTVVRDQRFDVVRVVEQGDQLAVQATWSATTTTDLGEVPAGTPLVAHVGAFYEMRDGLVLRQSSYDCYEPVS